MVRESQVQCTHRETDRTYDTWVGIKSRNVWYARKHSHSVSARTRRTLSAHAHTYTQLKAARVRLHTPHDNNNNNNKTAPYTCNRTACAQCAPLLIRTKYRKNYTRKSWRGKETNRKKEKSQCIDNTHEFHRSTQRQKNSAHSWRLSVRQAIVFAFVRCKFHFGWLKCSFFSNLFSICFFFFLFHFHSIPSIATTIALCELVATSNTNRKTIEKMERILRFCLFKKEKKK